MDVPLPSPWQLSVVGVVGVVAMVEGAVMGAAMVAVDGGDTSTTLIVMTSEDEATGDQRVIDGVGDVGDVDEAMTMKAGH